MNFKDLTLNTSYISHGENNIVNSLINPALKLSVLYQRSVAFFSSSVFKLLIDSLPLFISNGGKIQLIISPTLSDDDIDAINKGYETKQNMFMNKASLDMDKSLEEFDEDELKILYELVSKGTLDFKIACMKNNIGIYHDKLGILTDKNNNKIIFYGSPNSSFNAYNNNYERIRVITNWDGLNNKLIASEEAEFSSIWNNSNEFLEVYSFRDAVKNKIINEIERKKSKAKEPVKLFDYQKTAISNWVKNYYKGFYVMATGTGKTWTAIFSAKELLKVSNALIVILAPYKHLINQWARDVEKLFNDAEIVMVYSDNVDWRNQAKNALIMKKYDDSKIVILLSTIISFYSNDFQKILSSDFGEKLLIVDEAHRFVRRDSNVRAKFDYFLGLSATPSNGKNTSSKDELLDYFGGEVFSLPIETALDKDFLVKYRYFPIYIDSTIEEEENFKYWTQVVASSFDKNGNVKNSDKLKEALRNRLRVLSMAEKKQLNLDKILNDVINEKHFADKKHFIVYCGDGKLDDGNRYINYVKQRLDGIGIKSSQFTASEDAKTRMALIDSFNDGLIDSLVAIRCLDEGVDIPSIEKALILSSNDNYREFVQRRGRILRRHDGKKEAYIYDVIVLPSKNTPGIAEIELRRFYEYARLAKNFDCELKNELYELLDRYNLTLNDIKFKANEQMEDDLDE